MLQHILPVDFFPSDVAPPIVNFNNHLLLRLFQKVRLFDKWNWSILYEECFRRFKAFPGFAQAKFGCGGFGFRLKSILDKNDTSFKSDQKWLENNNFALLVKIRGTHCITGYDCTFLFLLWFKSFCLYHKESRNPYLNLQSTSLINFGVPLSSQAKHTYFWSS